MKFKHSGGRGDIIYSLPILKYYSKYEHRTLLFLNSKENYKLDGIVGLSGQSIAELIPLIKTQPYVTDVFFWKNEPIDIDIDGFRKMQHFKNRKNTCKFILNTFKIPIDEIQQPWLETEEKKVAEVIFHRSTRYHNESVVKHLKTLVKTYKKYAIFVGFKEEWIDFCRKIGFIPWYQTKDLLSLACTIKGCKLFIGNQSCPMAIAIALHKNYIQETCPRIPDCIFNLNTKNIHLLEEKNIKIL